MGSANRKGVEKINRYWVEEIHLEHSLRPFFDDGCCRNGCIIHPSYMLPPLFAIYYILYA